VFWIPTPAHRRAVDAATMSIGRAGTTVALAPANGPRYLYRPRRSCPGVPVRLRRSRGRSGSCPSGCRWPGRQCRAPVALPVLAARTRSPRRDSVWQKRSRLVSAGRPGRTLVQRLHVSVLSPWRVPLCGPAAVAEVLPVPTVSTGMEDDVRADRRRRLPNPSRYREFGRLPGNEAGSVPYVYIDR